MTTTTDYDVIIVGCGPVGITAANILGMYGVHTLVLEREDGIHRLPRAGTCDDEVMRIWQSIGLAETLMPNVLSQDLVQFLDSPKGKPFFELRGGGFGYGYPALMLIYQPFIEETLRNAVERFSSVEVRMEHEALSLTDSGDAVAVAVRDHGAGEDYDVTGRYVIGCDGGRSTIRQLLGIELRGETFQRWLVIDIAVDDPARYPPNFQFICDPKRPAINYPMALNHHRFQFMLQDDETPEQMETMEIARGFLAPWADVDEVKLVRQAVYIYHARIAEKWKAGRVFLAGDSAHLTPPFAGQGMSSGIRDVDNLCWKLAFVLQGRADRRLLDTYEAERAPHVAKMTRLARGLGIVLQTRRPVAASVRNGAFRVLARVPVVGARVIRGEFKPGPSIATGLMATARRRGRRSPEGTLFIQPEVQGPDGETTLLDEFLGHGFAVIGMEVDPRDGAGGTESGSLWESWSARFLRVVPRGQQAESIEGLETVVDSEGALAAWFGRHEVDLVVLRPDRYVFSVHNSAAEAPDELTQELREQMSPG